MTAAQFQSLITTWVTSIGNVLPLVLGLLISMMAAWQTLRQHSATLADIKQKMRTSNENRGNSSTPSPPGTNR